jgi:3-oxoacyl-[acyl-carrier-protein] synthase II
LFQNRGYFMRRRVAITGIGLITPLGIGIEPNWLALMAGESGIGPITQFDCSAFDVRIAGEVKDFDAAAWIPKREIKTLDRFLQFAIAAGSDAIADSGLPARFDDAAAERVGCYVGSGFGGVDTIQRNYGAFLSKGPRFGFSPYAIVATIINLAPGHLAIRHNIQGPSLSHVTACATGTHSVGEAFRIIRDGTCDVMLAGGVEAGIRELGIGGFNAARTLSTRNDAPQKASRPFDKNRNGFVLSEGAGILVLEELDHARTRSARIYAEILGYGLSTDAHHLTEPSPNGSGAQRCMRAALADAGIAKENVDYINAHGTSTVFNDISETEAIHGVFQEHAPKLQISSTKSMMGHCMGAAGAIEAAICALSLNRQCLPPTINLEEPDPQCNLDYIPNQSRKSPANIALSNSFGFGGMNACLVFGKNDGPKQVSGTNTH